MINQSTFSLGWYGTYLELLYFSLMACCWLEAAVAHMEWRARRHSFRLSTSYPVRLTRWLGHTSEAPRE